MSWVRRHANKLLLMGLILLSIAAWLAAYMQNWVLAYNDSMSHLNMARLVFDNQKPGLAQIGSVWLPLSHILSLPFVWIDWAWRTGLAGSVVSMAAFVCTAVGLYAIVMELTGRRFAAVIAAAAAALNLNLLYLQTTPLTEPLYVALLVGSVYFLVRYIKTAEAKFLLPLAFLTALQVMTRYDGWFVGIAIACILLLYELKERRLPIGKAIGNVLVYAVPVAFAGLLWIAWNTVIFDDPLYFATGPFSAQAQQEVINAQAGLITKGDVLMSVQAFGYSVADNAGWLVLNMALIGWLIYLNPFSNRQVVLRMAVMAVLLSVAAFNLLALYLGFSIVSMPELNWNPSSGTADSMFNVRYGILLLPFVAVGVGLLVARAMQGRHYTVVPLAMAVILVQALMTYSETPITLQDGQIGASAFVQYSMANELKSKVGPRDDVLMSMSYFNPVAHASTLELRQFVHEGASRQWKEGLIHPENNIEWIVMSNGNPADPVYSNLTEHKKDELQRYYTLEYQDSYARIYRLTDHTALN